MGHTSVKGVKDSYLEVSLNNFDTWLNSGEVEPQTPSKEDDCSNRSSTAAQTKRTTMTQAYTGFEQCASF